MAPGRHALRRWQAALAVLLACAGGVGPARAQSCGKALTQSDLNICADRAFRHADAGLNAAYAQVLARLGGDADTKQKLVAAQRAWIGFRDAECIFESAGAAGGSMQPMVASGCLEAQTRTRLKQLETLLHCPEGDMGCPVPAR